MSEIYIIDARGLSCPEPALLTREAMTKLGKGAVRVWADTDTAVENITRVANNNGWSIKTTKLDSSFQLDLTK